MTALAMAVSAHAQENQAKKIKIGVIYDLTGPLAGGGSELQYIGAKIMLDQYSKTGVEGYKVEAVYADAQSKPEKNDRVADAPQRERFLSGVRHRERCFFYQGCSPNRNAGRGAGVAFNRTNKPNPDQVASGCFKGALESCGSRTLSTRLGSRARPGGACSRQRDEVNVTSHC